MRNHWLIALGSLYLTLWIALITQQIDPSHKEVPCWFFNPLLGESSLSEMITLVGYWLAIALCANHFRRKRHKGYLALAAFCFGLFLEESNYGAAFLRFFQGLHVHEGKALHNLIEDRYTKPYHEIEYVVQTLLFLGAYFGLPFLMWRSRRSRPLLALSLIPAAIWGIFLVREAQWTSAFGQELYPHHPCVSIDEEIVETLFPFSLAYLLLLHRLWDTPSESA